MMDEMTLNISKNIRRIKVNEAGEFITLNFDDETLIPRLVNLMKEFEVVADEYTRKSAEIGELPEETQRERTEKIITSATFHLEACSVLKQKVDEAFQDDVCKKVFGDIVPSVSAFAEFFAQLGEILNQFGKEIAGERQARIAKYTAKYARRE